MELSWSVCLYNLLFRIQHPENRGGGSSTACLRLKNSILGQNMAIFGCFFMQIAKFWCIHMLQIVFL